MQSNAAFVQRQSQDENLDMIGVRTAVANEDSNMSVGHQMAIYHDIQRRNTENNQDPSEIAVLS